MHAGCSSAHRMHACRLLADSLGVMLPKANLRSLVTRHAAEMITQLYAPYEDEAAGGLRGARERAERGSEALRKEGSENREMGEPLCRGLGEPMT